FLKPRASHCVRQNCHYFVSFFCLAHLAMLALLAISLRCSGVSFLASALPPFKPPSLPSATAWGFFFFTIGSKQESMTQPRGKARFTLTSVSAHGYDSVVK